MEENFEIRSYGTSELASLYLPNINHRAATRTLQSWIDRVPGLREQLREAGLKRGAKIITPAQVRLIVEALGEP